MAHTKTAARKLATQAEWTLLESSFAPNLKEITAGRLAQKVTRSRKLQDKYRDLSRQQSGEARGKRKAKSTRPAKGNANTVAKQEMFSEALTRFEGQLEKLQAKAARETARKAKTAAKQSAAASRKSTKTAAKTPGKQARRARR